MVARWGISARPPVPSDNYQRELKETEPAARPMNAESTGPPFYAFRAGSLCLPFLEVPMRVDFSLLNFYSAKNSLLIVSCILNGELLNGGVLNGGILNGGLLHDST
jgi:hypothetical protein